MGHIESIDDEDTLLKRIIDFSRCNGDLYYSKKIIKEYLSQNTSTQELFENIISNQSSSSEDEQQSNPSFVELLHQLLEKRRKYRK